MPAWKFRELLDACNRKKWAISHLDDGCIPVFLHIADNFDGYIALIFPVPAFQDPSKGAYASNFLLDEDCTVYIF